jgi:hypothetical protein
VSKRSKFLRAAEKLESIGGKLNGFYRQPPGWFDKVGLRFARVYTPELRRRDLDANPERFFGHFASFVADLVDRAKKVKVSEIPRTKQWKWLRGQLMALRKSGPQKLRELKRIVAELPRERESEFYNAYSETERNESVEKAMQRLDDNNTARICFFLICMGPFIAAKKFHTVSDLVRAFMQFEELDPARKRFLKENESARRSLVGQFRDICSEDGLKLHPRGAPRKILLRSR